MFVVSILGFDRKAHLSIEFEAVENDVART